MFRCRTRRFRTGRCTESGPGSPNGRDLDGSSAHRPTRGCMTISGGSAAARSTPAQCEEIRPTSARWRACCRARKEKAGPLSAAERAEIERHPLYTWEISSPVNAFQDFARTGSLHHEKLDGSGYPGGVRREGLDVAARILCVADMYEPLTADPPHRVGMAPETALAILRAEAGTRLCADTVCALADSIAASAAFRQPGRRTPGRATDLGEIGARLLTGAPNVKTAGGPCWRSRTRERARHGCRLVRRARGRERTSHERRRYSPHRVPPCCQ